MDEYKFSSRSDEETNTRRYEILQDSLGDFKRSGWTGHFKDYAAALKEEGLSYRRENMQADFRRGQAIEQAGSDSAREASNAWFDRVFEPTRKACAGKSGRAASETIAQYRKNMEALDADLAYEMSQIMEMFNIDFYSDE